MIVRIDQQNIHTNTQISTKYRNAPSLSLNNKQYQQVSFNPKKQTCNQTTLKLKNQNQQCKVMPNCFRLINKASNSHHMLKSFYEPIIQNGKCLSGLSTALQSKNFSFDKNDSKSGKDRSQTTNSLLKKQDGSTKLKGVLQRIYVQRQTQKPKTKIPIQNYSLTQNPSNNLFRKVPIQTEQLGVKQNIEDCSLSIKKFQYRSTHKAAQKKPKQVRAIRNKKQENLIRKWIDVSNSIEYENQKLNQQRKCIQNCLKNKIEAAHLIEILHVIQIVEKQKNTFPQKQFIVSELTKLFQLLKILMTQIKNKENLLNVKHIIDSPEKNANMELVGQKECNQSIEKHLKFKTRNTQPIKFKSSSKKQKSLKNIKKVVFHENLSETKTSFFVQNNQSMKLYLKNLYRHFIKKGTDGSQENGNELKKFQNWVLHALRCNKIFKNADIHSNEGTDEQTNFKQNEKEETDLKKENINSSNLELRQLIFNTLNSKSLNVNIQQRKRRQRRTVSFSTRRKAYLERYKYLMSPKAKSEKTYSYNNQGDKPSNQNKFKFLRRGQGKYSKIKIQPPSKAKLKSRKQTIKELQSQQSLQPSTSKHEILEEQKSFHVEHLNDDLYQQNCHSITRSNSSSNISVNKSIILRDSQLLQLVGSLGKQETIQSRKKFRNSLKKPTTKKQRKSSILNARKRESFDQFQEQDKVSYFKTKNFLKGSALNGEEKQQNAKIKVPSKTKHLSRLQNEESDERNEDAFSNRNKENENILNEEKFQNKRNLLTQSRGGKKFKANQQLMQKMQNLKTEFRKMLEPRIQIEGPSVFCRIIPNKRDINNTFFIGNSPDGSWEMNGPKDINSTTSKRQISRFNGNLFGKQVMRMNLANKLIQNSNSLIQTNLGVRT